MHARVNGRDQRIEKAGVRNEKTDGATLACTHARTHARKCMIDRKEGASVLNLLNKTRANKHRKRERERERASARQTTVGMWRRMLTRFHTHIALTGR